MSFLNVSVIIPVHNAEKYLSKCLNSLFNQTLPDFEVICINDGSTDQSQEILEQFKKSHPNLRLLTQKNLGAGPARNQGIKQAQGEYIAFLDSDDYYPDRHVLEDLYQAAKHNQASICGGSFSEDWGGWIKKTFEEDFKQYRFDKEGWIEYSDYQYDYGFHRFLYQKELLMQNKILFPSYIRFQDPPFFVRAMITARKFYALPRVSYCYRCGHQHLYWDESRASALVKGLTDNLIASKQHSLKELHRLTVHRLENEFRSEIAQNLTRENTELLDLLFFANEQIDKEMVNGTELCENITPIIQEAFVSKDSQSERELYQKYAEEIDLLRNSWTYKIGATVLYVPKRVREMWINLRKKRIKH